LFSIYSEKIRILDVTENSGAIILNEIPLPGYASLYFLKNFFIINGNNKCIIKKWDKSELTDYYVISGRISVLKVYGNMMYYYYEYYNTDRALRILDMETLEEQCVSESVGILYNYPIIELFKSDMLGYIDIRSQKTAWFDKDIDNLKGNMLASLGDYRIIDVLLITDTEFVFMTWEEICTYSLEDRVLKAVLNKNDAGYYETFTDIGGKMLLNYYEIRTTHGVSFLYSFKDRAIIYRIRRNWDTDENFTVYGRISMGFYEANDRLFMYPAYYEVDTDK
jgi:hypothetical protein